MNIRTLQLSREIWVFLLVTGVMSGVYLYQTTGASALDRAPVPQLTPATLNVGQVVDLGITLISPDSFRLGCASDEKDGDAHCAFTNDGKPFADGSTKPEDVIMPYMTVDNVLVLIPGLWQQPALAKRLQDEPASKFANVEQFEEHRFTATCKLKVDKQLKNFKVRWNTTQPWSDRDTASVGRAYDCKIADSRLTAFDRVSKLFTELHTHAPEARGDDDGLSIDDVRARYFRRPGRSRNRRRHRHRPRNCA